MADDTPSLWRRLREQKPEAAPPPPAAPAFRPATPLPDAREAYEPFITKDRVMALQIRGDGFAHAVSYHHLVVTSYNPDSYDKIILTLGHMLVAIIGQNLRPIVESIAMHTCEVIQEYRPAKHILPQPVDPAAPFIERITVDVMNPDVRREVESLTKKRSPSSPDGMTAPERSKDGIR